MESSLRRNVYFINIFFIFQKTTYSNPTSPGRLPSNNFGRAMNGNDFDISLLWPSLLGGSPHKSLYSWVVLLPRVDEDDDDDDEMMLLFVVVAWWLGANPITATTLDRTKADSNSCILVLLWMKELASILAYVQRGIVAQQTHTHKITIWWVDCRRYIIHHALLESELSLCPIEREWLPQTTSANEKQNTNRYDIKVPMCCTFSS